VFTYLCDLFLKGESESGATEGEGPRSIGYVLQPLDDEGGGDVEGEIPYDVKVWRIYGARNTQLSSFGFTTHDSFYIFIFSPPSHGLEMVSGNPRSIL